VCEGQEWREKENSRCAWALEREKMTKPPPPFFFVWLLVAFFEHLNFPRDQLSRQKKKREETKKKFAEMGSGIANSECANRRRGIAKPRAEEEKLILCWLKTKRAPIPKKNK
jgi:hypothetical protein